MDKEKTRAYMREWGQKNRKGKPRYRLIEMNQRAVLKTTVLSHYGFEASLRCCWPGCEVSDIDMLTLDHIDNGGKDERKAGTHRTGDGMYRRLRKLGYPKGFQTLCWNHQWKKEIKRKRDHVIKRFEESRLAALIKETI